MYVVPNIAKSIVEYFFKQQKFSPGDTDGLGNTAGVPVFAIAVMLCAEIKKRISAMQ